jgi:hypothetical protein
VTATDRGRLRPGRSTAFIVIGKTAWGPNFNPEHFAAG